MILASLHRQSPDNEIVWEHKPLQSTLLGRTLTVPKTQVSDSLLAL